MTKFFIIPLSLAAVFAFGSLSAQEGAPAKKQNERAKKERRQKKNKNESVKVNLDLALRGIWHGGDDVADRPNPAHSLIGVGTDNHSYTDFQARKLRVGFSGDVRRDWYYDINLRAENILVAAPAVHQAFIGYRAGKIGNLQMGGFKLPFSRENLTSISKLATLERSTVTNEIGHLLDVGVALKGRALRKKLAYSAGIFNGNGGFISGVNGQSLLSNGELNQAPMLSARLQYDIFGPYKDGSSFFKGGKNVSVGAGSYYQSTASPMAPFYGETEGLLAYTVDAAVVVDKLYFETGMTGARGETFNQDQSALGFYAQAGYFVYKKMVQPVIKWETMDNDVWDNLRNESVQYLHFGVNIYPVKQHQLKMQANYQLGLNDNITGESAGLGDDYFAIQLQMLY